MVIVKLKIRAFTAVASLVLAGPVLAACAGTASSSSGGSGGAVTLSLVAYSTPQAAYEQAHQGLPEDRRRQERHVHPVLRRLRRPEPGRRGRPQGRRRRTSRSSPTSPAWSRPGWSPTTGTPTSTRAWSPTRSSVIGTRKGNPKNIKTWDDLIKPGVAGHHAQPVHLGRRALEHHGRRTARSRTRAPTTPPASTYLQRAVQERPGAGRQRAASRCRRSPAARVTPSSPTRTRRIFAQQNGQAIDYTVPDSTILIENPIAVTKNSAHPAEAKAFLDFLHTPAGAEDLGRERLPPGRAGRRRADVPDAAAAVHDRRPRRLDAGDQGVLRPEQGRDGRRSSRASASPSAKSSTCESSRGSHARRRLDRRRPPDGRCPRAAAGRRPGAGRPQPRPGTGLGLGHGGAST